MYQQLFKIIEDRKRTLPENSYTSTLLNGGEEMIWRKINEEALEVILASRGEGNLRVIEEAADLIYHLFVLLASHDISSTDIEEELRKRHEA